MPFVSQAQRRKLWTENPELAAKMEAETPTDRPLPERVPEKRKKRSKR